ncbi:MAG TPA: hypothetical protein PKE55_11545, partial [Kiritimatiellia bacterium]|nr:hypothetical protein [Kiritimatiellia bacterium]
LVGRGRGGDRGLPVGSLAAPGRTVMFADAAFLEFRRGVGRLIEYSFAEPRFHLADLTPEPAYPAIPSVHFRHQGQAHVGWADGRVSSESRWGSYSPHHDEQDLGWFGDPDVDFFKPF